MRKIYAVVSLLFVIPFFSFGQLIVTPTQNVTTIMNSLLGGGLTYSNVNIVCPSNAMGTFNGTATNLGLANGIMLTTGSCATAVGPNNIGSAGVCNGTLSNDPQLNTIEPLADYDLCMLEFDVVPQCNTLQIRFVFGSEEYPEFVSSSFNDAFGFFITGPGPACQPNFYSNTNVATLPNNITPVSIDNVNNISNSAYYFNNTGGATIQYDGFTTVLTRTITVCPCQTYRFKIAIADAGDCVYDSGVFLDFFQCSAPVTPSATFTPSGCSCTATATASATGGTAPYQYSWLPSNQTTQTITGLCPGTYTVWVKDAISCSQWVQTTVTVTGSSTPITVNTSMTQPSCFGGCNGTATATPSGGTGPYTYLWTPSSQTTQTASGLCAGTYTVVVTDASGCTGTSTIVVTQPTQLTATQAQTNVLCNGQCNGTATVTASGATPPYTYNWAPSGGTNATATGLCAGTYTVTVTDFRGCTTTRTYTITQPSILSSSLSQVNVLCNGQCNGSATITVSGGTPGYSYVWAPSGGNAATGTGLCAGTYTVTVTDANGCTHQRNVTITQPTALTATQSQVNVLCNNQCTGSATVVASGGTPIYTYAWAPSGGNAASATGLCAGTYTVTITDANGCTITRNFTITQPTALTATQSQVNALCNNQCTGSATVVASGGTTPYSYNWTPSGGTNASATGLCAGTYTVTITDANGCTITRNFTITQPPAITLSTSATQATCGQSNGTAAVAATGGTPGYTYLWAPSGGTNASATGLPANSYTVTVTDANGCTAQATVNVPSANGPTASITAQTNPLCFGLCTGTATVTATGGQSPYAYLWNPTAQTTQTATGLCAGTYTVTVTDANSCTFQTSVTITQPTQLTVTNGAITNVTCFALCNGSASVTASGGTTPYSYNWAPSGGNAASATGLCAGTYTVTVTDANGCTVQTNITITQPTQLTQQVAGFPATCFGSCDGLGVTIPAGGTLPYTYNWLPNGGTNPSATGLCAGIYTITVTDANGCTVVGTATVTEPPAIVLVMSATTANCGQSDGSATVNASGGSGGYTYSWNTNPSQSTSTATGIASGNYTVYVTDANGCSTSASVFVPNALGVVASISGQTSTLCFGSCDGTATALPSGGTGPYSFLWSNAQTTATATGLCAGAYTVTITDAVGCSDTATVTIVQPTQVAVTTTTPAAICIGQCATLVATGSGGTPNYIYSWASSGPNVCPTTTTTYTVYVTDANGCTGATATVTVTVNPPLNVTANPNPATICIGGSSQLSAVGSGGNGGPYSYVWIPGNLNGQNVTVTPTATTTYTVIIADGCGTPPDSVSITVTVNPAPIITFVSSDSSGCAPLCIDFTDNTVGAAAWSWSFTGATPSSSTQQNPTNICYLNAGAFNVSLTVTTGAGCTSTVTANNMINVFGSPVAAFNASADSVSILNPTICFTDASQNATSWTWNFGDINNGSSNAQNPCYTFPDTGRYCVNLSVENNDGCLDSISYCVIVNPDFAIYVPNAFTPENGDGNNDEFLPQGMGIDKGKFEMWIFDRWGNMIWYSQKWGVGWDGRANSGKNVAQQDVYVWKIVCYDIFGQKHSLIGHVSIIK